MEEQIKQAVVDTFTKKMKDAESEIAAASAGIMRKHFPWLESYGVCYGNYVHLMFEFDKWPFNAEISRRVKAAADKIINNALKED